MTALPDETVLAIAGRDGDGINVEIAEIYHPATPGVPDSWVDMPQTADKNLPVYPFMFVLPYGSNVFYAGAHGGALPNGNTYILDLEEEMAPWSEPIESIRTASGSAVMYEPGKVLKCGGDDLDLNVLTPVTQMIDLSDPASPLPDSWDTDPLSWDMTTARRKHNLVLLADGTILAVGGETFVHGAESGVWLPVYEAELFDPNGLDPQWQRMALMQKKRLHHSTALLLPDATVLAAGLPDFLGPTAEIYSPKYLFEAGGGLAPRPVIGYAPTDVPYGTSFSVILSGASEVPVEEIAKVTFLRLGSTTHGFDMDQRYLSLAVQLDASQENALIVEAPADANLAPPGYYMLFLISDDGVPSIAKYIRLYDPSP